MHDVSAALGNHSTKNGHSQKSKIANNVQNLVTHKLIRETQSGLIQHTFGGQHDCVFQRTAADQICAPQRLDLLGKTKGACCRDLATKAAIVQRNRKPLNPDHWVREVNETINLVSICRLHTDASITLLKCHSFSDQ